MNRTSLLLITTITMVCALLLGSAVHAQVATAILYGTVLDSSNAAIGGATVTLSNDLTGVSLSATSSAVGEFTFTSLPGGEYAITIEAPGFSPLRQTGLSLVAGQRVRRSFSLQVGAVTETVEVTAENVLISTVNAEQRKDLNETQVKELPAYRRDWSQLLNLNNGATVTGSGTVTMNALPAAGFRLTVDGTDNEMDSEFPSVTMYQNFLFIKAISLDAIEEVNVAKGITSAEIGSMSGNVNLTTKRGSNEIHGSVFEQNQTENLSARNFFVAGKPPLVYNQFGGSVGGPIIKNKLFAFGLYDGYRLKSFRSVVGPVPTPKFREEMMAAIPSPELEAYLGLFGLPTEPHGPDADIGTFRGAQSESAVDNHVFTRWDWNFRDDTFVSGRYSRLRPSRTIPRGPGVGPHNFREWSGRSEAVTLRVTHAKPTWTSETTFGYNFNDTPRLDGIYDLNETPCVTGVGFGTCGEVHFKEGSTKTFEETVAMTKGRHSIKFGGSFIDRFAGRLNEEVPVVSFANKEKLLANEPERITYTFGQAAYRIFMFQTSFFFQDDFKVSRNFMLNLGVRHDYWSVPHERDDRIFNRDSLPGLFGLGPLRDPNSMYEADFNNFSPRLGFAWTLDDNAKTVVRGGTGIFHSTHSIFGGPVLIVSNDVYEPFRERFSTLEIQRFGIQYPTSNDEAKPLVRALGRISGATIDPNNPNPYSLQWTLSVQRQLTNTLVLETSYVGNHGVKLVGRILSNQVDPVTGLRQLDGYGSFSHYDATGSSYYHSWQTELRKRFADNLSFNMYYTWARSMSHGSGDLLSADLPQDNYNRRIEKGPSLYDIRHRFVSNFLYELPFGKAGANRAQRLVLGGWQFGGILTAQTGLPLNVVQSSSRASSRPDYIGGPATLSSSSYKRDLQYINPRAFAMVPVGELSGATLRPGNIGRNALRGFGFWTLDLALSKNLYLSERVRLQIRGDMFNSLNHTNFSGISNRIRRGNFGQITSTRDSRLVQISARLSF